MRIALLTVTLPLLMAAEPLAPAPAAQPPAEGRPAAESDPLDLNRLAAYDPMYFILGTRTVTNAKFQLSFAYRLYKPFHVSYTQTSLWDLESESKPFYDTAYKPRAWLGEDDLIKAGWCSRLGGEVGLGHESNGRSGADSRSINLAFIKPKLRWGEAKGWHADVEPMVYCYLEKEDNPDIARYRGYCDLNLSLTQYRGLQVATLLRKGTDHRLGVGSIQVDVSYALGRWLGGGDGPYLQFQYFNGYGESILDYNVQRKSQFRIGLEIVR